MKYPKPLGSIFLLLGWLLLASCTQSSPSPPEIPVLSNALEILQPPAVSSIKNAHPNSRSPESDNFKIKLVRTGASGALERLVDQPSFAVSASVPLNGTAGDRINVNVGNSFSITCLLNTNKGPITDLRPVYVNPGGIISTTSTVVNASGTTVNLQADAQGDTIVTFASPYYGMYLDIYVNVGAGGGPPPPPPVGILAFQQSTYSVNENGGPLVLTIERSGATTHEVSVNVSMNQATATGGLDYSALLQLVTFAAGETVKNISVPITDDLLVEGDETFNPTLTNPQPDGQASLGSPYTAVATIMDNDVLAEIALSAPTYSIGEGAGNLAVQVNRTGSTGNAVSVDLSLGGGTATGGGTDYTDNTFLVNFGAGITTQIVNIPITDDALAEGNETFGINLLNAAPVGQAVLKAPSTATATIVDNDVAPADLAFSAASYNVNENGGNLAVQVNRSGNTTNAVTVDVTMSDVTATGGGTDYTSTTIPVSFGAGITFQIVNIPINNDALVEGNETFNLALANQGPPGQANLIAPATATATIIDDDTPPATALLALSSTTYSLGENGGNMVVQLERSGNTANHVRVDVTFADITATGGGTDYNSTTQTVDFLATEITKTINIPIIDEALVESDETFTINLGNETVQAGGGSVALGAPSTATGTITNDDATAEITLASATYNVNENIGTGLLAIQVNRGINTGNTVSVDVTMTDNTATGGGTDYDSTTQNVTFNPAETNKTVNIPITDDALVEGNETFTITLANPSPVAQAVLGTPANATATIVDDDLPPGTDSITANATQITFGVPPAPNKVKSLQIVGPGGETSTVFVSPGNDNKLMRVDAYDNPGNLVAGLTDYVWYFNTLSPYPGYVNYPAGAGTPSNQADLIAQLTGTGSVQLIAESLSLGITDSITIQVLDVQPQVTAFSVTPAPVSNCSVGLPSGSDTVCNITLNAGTNYSFTTNFVDANADVIATEPPNGMAYEQVFGFPPPATEGVAAPGNAFNVYVQGFAGDLNSGSISYGYSYSGGITNKSYTAGLNLKSGGTGSMRMRINTGSGQTRNHTWNITVL